MTGETQACLYGGTSFDRVVIERPGQPYITAFIACRRCGVMFYAPIKAGRWGADAVVPTSPKARASELPGRDSPPKEHQHGNDEQEDRSET